MAVDRLKIFTAGAALCVAVALAGAVNASMHPVVVEAANDSGQFSNYTDHVLPILQANCYRCHGGMNHRGGLNMTTRASLLKGGHHGPAVVPGHPEQSLLVKLIRHQGPADDPMNMPPDPKPKLSDADIATVEAWIRAGAVMPPPPADAPAGMK